MLFPLLTRKECVLFGRQLAGPTDRSWPITDGRPRGKGRAPCSGICSRNRGAVEHRVRARMACCSTRGPCAAVRRGRQAACGGSRHGEDMDARVEATQERLPDARQASSGVAFSFTPGIQQLLLRCSASGIHAVACPPLFGPASPFAPLLRRSGYLSLGHAEKSDSVAEGDRPPLIFEASRQLRRHFLPDAPKTTTTLPAPPHNSTSHPRRAPARCTDAASCASHR